MNQRKYFVSYRCTFYNDHPSISGHAVIYMDDNFRMVDEDSLLELTNFTTHEVAILTGHRKEDINTVIINWKRMEEPC